MKPSRDDIDKLFDGLDTDSTNGDFVEFTFGDEKKLTPLGFDPRSVRDIERLIQGRAATLSVRRAAELLPGDDKLNRAWIRRQKGLVRKAANGDDFVIWGEVLKRHPPKDASGKAKVPRRRQPAGGLPRVSLGGRR